ncbi:MAG: YbaK/EbsC family protein [Fibrobacter sp.]|nr:YbaK/EbsC family protein [Fibrobacter sp.]
MWGRLKEYLDRNKIRYQLIIHSPAYTAQEIAASAHIPGLEMAKVVMIRADNKILMAVIPASHSIDLMRFKEICGAQNVQLAQEKDYINLLDDCEPGAEPPFGNLFNLPVFVSTILKQDSQIACNAGNHRELIRLSFDDFERLVKPEISSFSIKSQPGNKPF